MRPRLTDRLRYAFDNTLSRGPAALIGWLAVLSAAIILVFSLVIKLAGFAPDTPLVRVIWMSVMRTLDAGTMGGDTGSWPFLFGMLAVTLAGVFVISTLIGLLTAGVEDRLETLRRGRSRVLENGHTVILGWSEHIFSVISELVIANENQKQSCIVVLGDHDKVEMEDEIREKVGDTKRTRIVCRRGNPIEMADLELVSLHTCKAIIIMSPEEESPDSQVIKAMLAITNNPERRKEPYHIVAEIRDPKNMEVARLVGREEAELVLVGDVIARMVAQTCRQSGLSTVYTELLDFGGDEIYLRAEPALAGKQYGEVLAAYEDSSVIGIAPPGGPARLNPPMDTVIAADDRLIYISEDDDTIRLSGRTVTAVDSAAIRVHRRVEQKPERTLILGWNWRAPTIIIELDNYVAPGSEVLIVADFPAPPEEIGQCCQILAKQTCTFQEGDTTDRRTLDSLDVSSYHHVIVLAYSDALDRQQADARTLVTLLHLRDIAEHRGHTFSIVSEMLDIRNRNLAEVTQADDFIVSDKLVSLMLAQVAEEKALNSVFADLFDPEGSEIYLKPAERYVATGGPVNFYTVVEAARQCGETAIGYRLQNGTATETLGHGVVVNPDKSEAVTFSAGDRIIVLAED